MVAAFLKLVADGTTLMGGLHRGNSGQVMMSWSDVVGVQCCFYLSSFAARVVRTHCLAVDAPEVTDRISFKPSPPPRYVTDETLQLIDAWNLILIIHRLSEQAFR